MRYLTTCLFLLFVTTLSAQEEHFSDYTNAPVYFNPANTGYIPGQNSHRLTLSSRDQWSTALGSKAFRTISSSYDFRICGITEGDFIGVGARFLGDWQGDPTIRKTAGYLSLGYTKMLSGRGKEPSTLVGVGGEAGFLNYSLDIPNLTFDEQFDDPSIPDEVFFRSSPSVMDYGVGAHLYHDDEDASFRQIILSGSIKHLNQPRIGFFGNTLGGLTSSDSTATLRPRYNLQGGFTIMPRKKRNISFLATYSWQKPHNQLLVRGMLNFRENDRKEDIDNKLFALGLGFRLNNGVAGVASESAVILAHWYGKNFIMGFTGDVNIGKLSSGTRGLGGLELSVSYFFSNKNDCLYCRGA